MKKSVFFEKEINLIQDERLKETLQSYLDERVPEYFWKIGASSSGNFHPCFSQGEGGLVRHVKAVVMFAEELLRMVPYSEMNEELKDCTIAACIIHDCAKYGMEEFDRNQFSEHAPNGAKMFADWCAKTGYEVSSYLIDAVRTHMGQWAERKEDVPVTVVDKCVHMADYMASRSFIDIPSITKEYLAVNEDTP